MSIAQLQPPSNTYSTTADADLSRRLRIALSVKRRAGWHHVRVSARDGHVELAGVVPSFYDRQLIAALVRHVAGVMGIDDKLTVGDPSIRHQISQPENAWVSGDSQRDEHQWQNNFAHLPALPHSLDHAFALTLTAAPTT
jgi:hypothetical protein